MIWYPYQQMKTMAPPYEIVDAQGVYLYTRDQRLIDSVSSWWSVIHGYKHPRLNQALISQAEKFSHVMLGGLTHQPALRLAEKLENWLPGTLWRQVSAMIRSMRGLCIFIFTEMRSVDGGLWTNAENIRLCVRQRSTGIKLRSLLTVSVSLRILLLKLRAYRERLVSALIKRRL